MTSDQLITFIRKSNKVFVWLQLSEERGLYISTTKAALLEYLTSLEESFEEDLFFEFLEETNELYLGRSELSE